MYEVRVTTNFRASHSIRLYGGGMEPAHSHDWHVQAIFRGPALDEIGVLIDFTLVQRALQELIVPLLDANLNDTPLLKDVNPTAENLASRLFDALSDVLPTDAPLAGIEIREAPGCTAGYWQHEAE